MPKMKVFLCYAPEDASKVHDLHSRLSQDGVEAWIDENVLPGQDRNLEIEKAIRAADAIVLCLSNQSVSKEGHFQKEIRHALEISEEKPEGSIFIIPARLDGCSVPARLSRWRAVDLFRDGRFQVKEYDKLIQALNLRATGLGMLPSRAAESGARAMPVVEPSTERPPGVEKPVEAPPKPKPGCSVSVQVLVAVIGLIGVIMAPFASKLSEQVFNRPTVTATSTSTVTVTDTPTILITPTVTGTLPPTSTPTPTLPPNCAYRGVDDNQTILNLIQAEAIASNTKNISTMKAIFADEAIFRDYVQAPPKVWIGPVQRYAEDLFVKTDLKNVAHFDIVPVGQGINGDTATYASGSQGSYMDLTKAPRLWADFYNGSSVKGSDRATEFGSDHWTLKKDAYGCWLIVGFEIDAGHIRFP